MRFPTLRYGNPNEFRYYAQFIPKKDLARRLRRSVRTIENWLNEREKLPWWVPEILRLQKMEHDEMMRQMNMQPVRLKLGLVTPTATIYTLPEPKPMPARVQRPVPLDDNAPLSAQA